jgi:hypothetical protein
MSHTIVGLPSDRNKTFSTRISQELLEPYLDAAWLPGVPTYGGNVNHAALFHGVLYLLIHISSPVELPFVRYFRAIELPRWWR